MSVIFGYLEKLSKPIRLMFAQNAMQEMDFWNPDASDLWVKGSVAFGNHQLRTTPESVFEKLPYYDISSNCCVTSDARIDYREELATKLGIDWNEARNLSDSIFILKAYLKWGEDCVKYLYGDFAFAIWNENTGSLFCARDHLGCRPFCYYNDENRFIFSSLLSGILSNNEIQVQIRDQYIVDCLTDVLGSKTKTPYIDILNLEPGHTLSIRPNSEISIKKYWDLQHCELKNEISEQQAVEEFRVRIQQAVQQRLRSISPIGGELSGGLDSSGVLMTATELCKRSNIEIFSFSQALTNSQKFNHFPFRDDRENIESVLKKSGILKHFYITAEGAHGSLKSLIDSMKIYSKPIIQLYAVLSDLLYEKAEHNNVRVLLSGFGGDEGVTYKGAGYFEELVRLKNWSKFHEQLRKKTRETGGSYLKSYVMAMLKVVWPNIDKSLKKYGLLGDFRRKQFRYFALDKGVIKRFHPKGRYFKLTGLPNDNNLRRRQYKRIMHSHVTDRLEGSYISGLSHRIEYRYPLLDVKLLEFYFSLPSELKYKDGIGRYIFRQAMKDMLPERIRMRNDKLGSSIPNSQYRFMLDEREFRKLIDESQENNSFNYIDYAALHKMADKLVERDTKRRRSFGPRFFLSYISVLLAQKWQREGKIDIGIKC